MNWMNTNAVGRCLMRDLGLTEVSRSGISALARGSKVT